jgi:hypothetical protein
MSVIAHATTPDTMELDARPILHILLHALVPLAVALLFFRGQWRIAWLWMLAGWLIDIDHLWAEPIYMADRCSIGFHPLHRLPAIGLYVLLLLPRRTRLLAIGLLIHIGLDSLDCAWMRAAG